MAEAMKDLLKKMKDATDYVRDSCKPLMEKEPKLGESFRTFDKAVKEQVDRVAADSK
jgi:hypothetical protein